MIEICWPFRAEGYFGIRDDSTADTKLVKMSNDITDRINVSVEYVESPCV